MNEKKTEGSSKYARRAEIEMLGTPSGASFRIKSADLVNISLDSLEL